jgi:transposase
VRTGTAYVSDAASAFGFSRPAFYQARAAFERAGLPGLLPKKRGPRGPHKLTDEILTILDAKRDVDGSAVSARELAAHLQEEFGITAHPRSIERSLSRFRARQEKKR